MNGTFPIITCDHEDGCDQWTLDWYNALADNWRLLMEAGWQYDPRRPNEPQMCPKHAGAADEAAVSNCWCMTCEGAQLKARELAGDRMAVFSRRFIVCPECGNKRCPRATHHGLACTGSNDPGQPGSAYENVARPSGAVDEAPS